MPGEPEEQMAEQRRRRDGLVISPGGREMLRAEAARVRVVPFL